MEAQSISNIELLTDLVKSNFLAQRHEHEEMSEAKMRDKIAYEQRIKLLMREN